MIEEIEAHGLLSLFLESLFMDRSEFQRVLDNAASQRDCRVIDLMFNDDDNVFEVTLTKIQTGKRVDLQDCEYVHRAILAAFDRDVEDYALTVSSAGLSAEEADALLSNESDSSLNPELTDPSGN